jgi:cell division protein FtsB
MRNFVPYILFVLALVTLGLLLFGENSYDRIFDLRNNLAQQKQKNIEISEKVDNLKREVFGLQSSPRALEKAARNELGMARPNEQIYIFEKEKK